ncbi:cation channel sperm-associated auxiliary subunit delta isoform X7 [Homo sapiens]|uniref:cation channel sperm-associated auxiliary subunit delta isoform X7 n=1 Tax=Homo sapiens TaxID=9606 RepID=UPI0023DF179C|nr:cation channel sperm-associated auxiliary subunit delta isoform X7 [Homo sapiens]
MLMLMLVAAVTMWLRPLVTAQLCRSRTVRTGKVFNLIQDVQGDRLYFHPTTTRLIKHPCEKNIALYLGKQVFFTMDNFETSLLPFTIPTSMQVGVPEVTSAHFAGSLLLLVVDQKVYIYDYENNSWSMSLGIKHPVTHVSGDNCCYTGSLFCVHVSNLVFAYFRGDQISQTYIYYSNTGGFSFWKYHYDRQFADQYIWSEDVALMFRSPGTLEILTPLRDTAFPAFDFQKCLVNIQALLMDPELHVGKCKIEFLTGEFIYRMYTIDMHSQLELTASLIPQPGTSLIPLVMVSNPHSLGFQATFYENGYTSDGNTKYKLDIFLKQQQHWGRTDSNFTSSLKKATMSTLTVDIANKEISCVDIKPLSTLISVGCDLDKKIVIQNKVSACSMGILDPLTLQDNYSFIIEKEFYDPGFQGQQSSEDLHVFYSYQQLGCPLLVYYDTLWKPVVELWRKDSFQEVIDAEYVLLEVNGQFSYSYSLTAQSAMCTSQPQNWTTMIKEFRGPFFWNREASDVPNQKKHCAWLVTALSIPSGRQTQFVSLPTFCFYEKVCCLLIWPPVVYGVDHHPQSFGLQQRQNYVSCHDPNNNAPLRWPDVQYQILGGRTANQIIFGHNGFYVFYISIVDPYYSYCQLETIFSIYVYGAFPVQLVSAGVVILLIISSILGSVWLAYKTPKLLRTARGRRIKKCATQLCRRCKTVCQFRASATARAGTEPPGRHRTPHGGRSDH